jgi:hypothetical protein
MGKQRERAGGIHTLFPLSLIVCLWTVMPKTRVSIAKKLKLFPSKKFVGRVRVKKVDGVFSCRKGSNIHELLLLKTTKPGDTEHITDDHSKLARCLRTCLVQSVQASGRPEFLTEIPFFGIQTYGKFVEIDYLYGTRSDRLCLSNGSSL